MRPTIVFVSSHVAMISHPQAVTDLVPAAVAATSGRSEAGT
jgi:hypothetical protein